MRRWLSLQPLPCFAPEGTASGSDSTASPAAQTDPGAGEPGEGAQPAPGSAPDPAPAESGDPAKQDAGDDSPRRAKPDAKPAALLDTLKKAVDAPPKDPTSDPAKTAKAPPKADDGKADPKKEGEPKAADGGKTPPPEFHKHPDFVRMRTERDAYKPDAEDFRALKRTMDESGLSNEDLADAVALFSMLHNNPEAAHKELSELLGHCDKILGNELPADLKTQVDNGEMTEAAALEVSRARASTRRAQVTTERAQQHVQTSEAAAERTRLVADIKAGVGKWETDAAKLDPDFDKKRGDIGVMVSAILQHRGRAKPELGFYKDSADAVAVLKQAYALVNNQIERWRPKAEARRGNLGPGGNRTVIQPAGPAKNLREALDRSIGFTAR